MEKVGRAVRSPRSSAGSGTASGVTLEQVQRAIKDAASESDVSEEMARLRQEIAEVQAKLAANLVEHETSRQASASSPVLLGDAGEKNVLNTLSQVVHHSTNSTLSIPAPEWKTR